MFRAASTVVYLLDPSRSATVPTEHLQDAQAGILSVDRYQAYKTFVNKLEGTFPFAYCWAHVRRDFLRLASTRSAQEAWAMAWVERIGTRYHRNHQRVAAQEDPRRFADRDLHLREAISQMETHRDQELDDHHLLLVRQRGLTRLHKHWKGLTLFVEHPEIPLENNAAERALRGPGVSRKNFYGSGAQWRGAWTAMLVTVFQTLLRWNLNPKTWLERFVRVCAEQGGQPWIDVSRFLPWNMPPEDLEAYRRAPPDPSASSS